VSEILGAMGSPSCCYPCKVCGRVSGPIQLARIPINGCSRFGECAAVCNRAAGQPGHHATIVPRLIAAGADLSKVHAYRPRRLQRIRARRRPAQAGPPAHGSYERLSLPRVACNESQTPQPLHFTGFCATSEVFRFTRELALANRKTNLFSA
jgi:hypothetical protein